MVEKEEKEKKKKDEGRKDEAQAQSGIIVQPAVNANEKGGLKEIVAIQEVKEIEKVPVAEPVAIAPREEIRTEVPSSLENWKPATSLGKRVFSGEISDIDTVLNSGLPIREPQIIDKLVPEIKNEIVLIGGRTGKGGGVQRIPVKITAKMHRSGRRLSMSAFAVVGNENGLIGVGGGHALEARDAIGKAIQRAKLNLVRVRRGCGSWECRCGTEHSVAFKTTGKSGSVRVELLPAPKGIGLVADDESKKILRLAGIKDVWVRTFGNTSARINLISAIYDALKKLYVFDREAGKVRRKIAEETETDEEEEEGEEGEKGEKEEKEMSEEEISEQDKEINEGADEKIIEEEAAEEVAEEAAEKEVENEAEGEKE